MKQILSLTIAALMALGLTAPAFAAPGDTPDITGMAHDLSYGYSGDTDLGEIAPQDEHVEYIELTDDMFTWDGDYVPVATPTSLTSSQIRKARLDVRASNSRVLDSVAINRNESRIEVKFLDELTGVKEQDFDFEVVLSIDGRRQRDYAMSFTGTLANPVIEVYSGTDYVDISGGEVVEAMESVRDIDLDLGDGISISTRLMKGGLYYARAHRMPTDGGDRFMREHPSIEEAVTLKTAGLSSSACVITLDGWFNGYHVYNQDGEYLGLGSDRLPYAETYYLTNEKLDIPADAEPSPVPEAPAVPEAAETPAAPAQANQTPGAAATGAYPSNANANPSTGR